jgi:hypothetical protein
MIEYTVTTKKNTKGEDTCYISLLSHPTVFFTFEDVQFGQDGDKETVPVKFNIDFLSDDDALLDEVIADENFNNEIKQVFIEIIKLAEREAKELLEIK